MKKPLIKLYFISFPYLMLSTQYIRNSIIASSQRDYGPVPYFLQTYCLYLVIGVIAYLFFRALQVIDAKSRAIMESINIVILTLGVLNFMFFGIVPFNPITSFIAYDSGAAMGFIYVGFIGVDLLVILYTRWKQVCKRN